MVWVALSLRTGMGVIRGRREVNAAGGVEAAWDCWARQHSSKARDIETRVKAMSAWLKARDVVVLVSLGLVARLPGRRYVRA